jgi:hypothetical protein
MLDLSRHFMTQHIEIQNNGFDFDNQCDKLFCDNQYNRPNSNSNN